MEQVTLVPIAEDQWEFQVGCPHLEHIDSLPHAVSEPQPPKFDIPGLFAF